jgi:Xaa-Pro aminopeptidase
MRIEALQREIQTAGLDALAVTNRDNIRYLSGAAVGRAVLFVTPENAYLVTHFVDLEDAQKRAHGVQVLRHTAFGGEVVGQLATIPEGSRYHTIGFEADTLPVSQLEAFRDALPEADFRPTSGMVEQLRGVKDDRELDLLRRACGMADAAMERAAARLQEGITEREIGLDIDAFMRSQGADSIAFLLIQFGARSSLPHGEPLETPLRRGDLVLIDIGPAIEGYNADLTRTFTFGEADAKQREVYKTVLRAQMASLEAVRPGAVSEEVDAISRRIIEDAGYGEYYGHSLGHSIAGGPNLVPGSDVTLEPGNVVTVEPGIYIPDWGGVRIEDTVLVTENGHERLTHYPKELREISAGNG